MSHALEEKPHKATRPLGRSAVRFLQAFIAAALAGVLSACSGSGSGAPAPTVTVTETVFYELGEPVAPSEEEPSPTPSGDPASIEDFRAFLAEAYGDFEPLEFSGQGDSVVKLPEGVSYGVVSFSVPVGARIVVEPFSAERESVGYWYVDDYPTTTGSFLLFPRDTAVSLRVETDGAWSLTVEPLSDASELQFPAQGTGSGAFIYVGEADVWNVDAKGTGEIGIRLYSAPDFGSFKPDSLTFDASDGDLPYKGQVLGSSGPALVEVRISGAWTMTAE